jgi:type VI protein secretion system component Hcp
MLKLKTYHSKYIKSITMRTILLLLALSPFFGYTQNSAVFIKLTDAKGLPIKGEAVLKGYERWIGVTTLSSGGKNNTQLNFTMQVSGASADLKKALLNGELLPNGQVTVLSAAPSYGNPAISYTIKMENMVVSSCSESMGCNNMMNTAVVLQATRVGWTYYNQNATGGQTVSRKFGWDSETGREWSNF